MHGKKNTHIIILLTVDHHCPWVGTCIGKRNHQYFAVFLLYTAFHAAFSATEGLITIVKGYEYLVDGEPMWVNFPVWVVTIFGIMMLCVLGPFSLYHFWLIGQGRTTNEEVRGKYNQWHGNPFDRGTCSKNCLDSFVKHPSAILVPHNPKVDTEHVVCIVDGEKEYVRVYEGRYEVLARDVTKPSIFANMD